MLQEAAQQRGCSNLAVSRRQRLVQNTLEVVRDSFDPTAGLENAARAAMSEVAAAEAALIKQTALTKMLSMPREPKLTDFSDVVSGPARTTIEQQEAFCEVLSRPKVQQELQAADRPKASMRLLAQQQRRCSELAQARTRDDRGESCDEDLPALAGGWRELLNARAAQPAGATVEQARLQLAEMQRRAAERSRPTSAVEQSRRNTPRVVVGGIESEDAPDVAELRGIAEELLWVVLLQWRSCPKNPVKDRAPGHISNESPKDELEDRLGGLLLAAVGPTLRPVARKVLGPGTRLVRQTRAEFPRLAAHLGFRESEDMQPAPSSWTTSDVAAHTDNIRACRDKVLKSDLTKTLSQCARC